MAKKRPPTPPPARPKKSPVGPLPIKLWAAEAAQDQTLRDIAFDREAKRQGRLKLTRTPARDAKGRFLSKPPHGESGLAGRPAKAPKGQPAKQSRILDSLKKGKIPIPQVFQTITGGRRKGTKKYAFRFEGLKQGQELAAELLKQLTLKTLDGYGDLITQVVTKSKNQPLTADYLNAPAQGRENLKDFGKKYRDLLKQAGDDVTFIVYAYSKRNLFPPKKRKTSRRKSFTKRKKQESGARSTSKPMAGTSRRGKPTPKSSTRKGAARDASKSRKKTTKAVTPRK